MQPVRMTPATRRILTFLLSEPTRWSWGYDIRCHTGLAAGTVSPILRLWAEAGVLERRYEEHGERVQAARRGVPRIYVRIAAGRVDAVRQLLAGQITVAELPAPPPPATDPRRR